MSTCVPRLPAKSENSAARRFLRLGGLGAVAALAVVLLAGPASANAPFLLLTLDTTGQQGITLSDGR